MIIPVPLSKERRKERGFNQSEWIAGAFSRKSGIPVKPTALQKVRNTRTQVGLNREEREMNLRGAFMAEPLLIQEKKVLLVDDVMTTGSTFNECAFALKQHGASKVYCLSVATTDLD